uniref:Uncharacterized protein n=1 Tax=Picea glauca TaxID=3330 RepID=A0A117NFZ3_PICGL|nr:hypothetical protein ABT39_MTgene2071 [Picea glauca]
MRFPQYNPSSFNHKSIYIKGVRPPSAVQPLALPKKGERLRFYPYLAPRSKQKPPLLNNICSQSTRISFLFPSIYQSLRTY